MKVSVNEAKLTRFWARNYATIEQIFTLNVAFGPEKIPGLSRNRSGYRSFRYQFVLIQFDSVVTVSSVSGFKKEEYSPQMFFLFTSKIYFEVIEIVV